MLQALVKECNIHNESPHQVYQMMNIDLDGVKDKFSYTITKISSGEKQTGEETCSIYDRLYIYWQGKDDDDENANSQHITFDYGDISKFDKEAGVFVYEKGDFRIELKRNKPKYFSFAF